MKPGDLVRGKVPSDLTVNGQTRSRPVTGILMKKLPHAPAGYTNVWWQVLCEDGAVVEEVEHYMELVR